MKRLLSREARIRATALLDMMYAPSELAEELGIELFEVYKRLIPAGLPHSRDKTGHIWLHGPAVAKWVKMMPEREKKKKMAVDRAYCLRCKKPVKLVNPIKIVRDSLTLLQARCPKCGVVVNRGVKS